MEYNDIPRHVAIIMDGNGRWAQSKGLPRMAGHRAGMLAMKETIKHCSKLGIDHLTVYAFSTENWKRSPEEVSGIFSLLVFFVNKELQELHANNVKVNIIGDYEELPEDAVISIEKTIELTKNNTGLTFNIALNYGARKDILDAVKFALLSPSSANLAEKFSWRDISEETFSGLLSTGRNNIPDPELIIRSSGEKRLSNFLLWEAAYSELVFVDVLWPDFTTEELDKCISEYQSRQRRYGGRL